MVFNLEALFKAISIKSDETGKAGNFDGRIVQENLVASINTVIVHRLGRVPNGIIPIYQNAHGSVRVVSWDERLVVVEASANMTAKLLIL